jgi:di/tricarboxylate transporter
VWVSATSHGVHVAARVLMVPFVAGVGSEVGVVRVACLHLVAFGSSVSLQVMQQQC